MSDPPSAAALAAHESRPSLAAVVPAGDGPPTLDRCLAALRAGRRPPDELIAQSEPREAGPAAARNAGAARCRADVLVFVDADVEVHADALARVEARFAADPGLSAIFGAYDEDPGAPGLTSRFRNLLHHHVHASSAGEAETFWAGLGAIRREEFEALGGFDAELFRRPSVEDIELGMRLRERRGRIVLDPAIRGRHLKAWSPWTMVRTDFAQRGVPWMRLLLRGGSGRRSLNLGPRQRATALGSVLFVAALLARRPRIASAALLGVVALNRDFYALLARRGGWSLLLAGVPLHLLHNLTAVASVPVAVLAHLGDRR